VFRHWYPTGACVNGKTILRDAAGVRSLRDKVASAYGLVTKPRGAMATASAKAVGSKDGVVWLTYVNR
jgi:cobalamin biosynthesis protein CbiG